MSALKKVGSVFNEDGDIAEHVWRRVAEEVAEELPFGNTLLFRDEVRRRVLALAADEVWDMDGGEETKLARGH